MQSILRRIRTMFYKWTEPSFKLPIHTEIATERLGTPYGGWIIPSNRLNANAICYLIGAGEDVSFDLALIDKFNCPAHIFDPTPRSIQHVQQLRQNITEGKKTACATSPDGFYPAYPASLAPKIELHPVGIWNEDTTLRFFAPPNDAYVSHSLVNLQQSDRFIEVPVERLKTVCAKLGHTRIDLLKMDIEGAEYQVIESIIADKIEIDILCIEFDESAAHHFDGKYMQRIAGALTSLIEFGYIIVAKESSCHNYTLLHQRLL
jgi:hypothetical protein